jgi:hypothetical protein
LGFLVFRVPVAGVFAFDGVSISLPLFRQGFFFESFAVFVFVAHISLDIFTRSPPECIRIELSFTAFAKVAVRCLLAFWMPPVVLKFTFPFAHLMDVLFTLSD